MLLVRIRHLSEREYVKTLLYCIDNDVELVVNQLFLLQCYSAWQSCVT